MAKNINIAFIGAGNMASSLIGGLIADGYSPKHIWASNLLVEKLQQLETQFGIHTTSDNLMAAENADVLVLSVKPQILHEVATELAPLLQRRRPLIISIAAMIPMRLLEQWLGADLAIVRCMPNTPALIGCGATGMFANANINPQQHSIAENIMRAVGLTVWIEQEKMMDIVTALSGSGPAYFFLTIEALQHAAIKLGLPHDAARLLTLQTALGAARLALETNTEITELRQQVTSPGGTTERAVAVLEQGQLRELYLQALKAGIARADELVSQLED